MEGVYKADYLNSVIGQLLIDLDSISGKAESVIQFWFGDKRLSIRDSILVPLSCFQQSQILL